MNIVYKFYCIFNFAAQAGVRHSIKEPRNYIDTNIVGFFNILELTKKYNIRKLFYASSSSVYGEKNSNTADGVRRAINAYEPETHPTAKDRSAQTAFVISDGDLLALSRTLDDDVRPRIIYHSHPNGRAYFSETDKANASDPWGDGPAYPVHQIVVGIDGDRVQEARQFAWDDEAEDFVEIAEYEGLDI